MRTLVAITLAICCLALVGCSRLPWRSSPEPPSLPPQQYGGTYPNSYDPLSKPNSQKGIQELVRPGAAIATSDMSSGEPIRTGAGVDLRALVLSSATTSPQGSTTPLAARAPGTGQDVNGCWPVLHFTSLTLCRHGLASAAGPPHSTQRSRAES